MHTIRAEGINDAFVEGWWALRTNGQPELSERGPVLAMPGPVCTEYSDPRKRVLFSERRDANPVFHLMEAIWMLAGSNDVRFLEQFNSGYRNYADPGTDVVWGAYGNRWRYVDTSPGMASMDQLKMLVYLLTENPLSRRAVLSMWDPVLDLGTDHADRPCNLNCMFDCRGGVLNMTVTCRSNDMLWGAYGANVVHFSMLQEWMAAALKMPIGVYRQFSNNFHVYTDNEMVKSFIVSPQGEYEGSYPTIIPMVQPGASADDFLEDCEKLVTDPKSFSFKSYFISEVAHPLMLAYLDRKAGKPWNVNYVPNCDWKQAFLEWVDRRAKK